jgi:hypothetical protein
MVCRSVLIHRAEVPRFRAVHEEVVKLDQDFGLAYSGWHGGLVWQSAEDAVHTTREAPSNL